MKKSPYILVLAASLFFAFAHAAPAYACDPAATDGNDGCTATQYCDESTLVCKDLSSAPSNTGANGSAAGQNTATPSATSNTSAATTPTGAAATTQTGGPSDPGNFVPLTSLPAIQGLTNTSDLSSFFNQLYKICIGVAAALAFIKIIQAGVMYMGGDSVTETKQARAMIATSIGGLILVLSPAIVFGIINPNILSLKVGFSALAPAAPTGATTPTTATTGAMTYISVTSAADCTSKGGTATVNGSAVTCAVPTGSAAAATSCSDYEYESAIPTGQACDPGAGEGYVQISAQCCSSLQSGYICCGESKK